MPCVCRGSEERYSETQEIEIAHQLYAASGIRPWIAAPSALNTTRETWDLDAFVLVDSTPNEPPIQDPTLREDQYHLLLPSQSIRNQLEPSWSTNGT